MVTHQLRRTFLVTGSDSPVTIRAGAARVGFTHVMAIGRDLKDSFTIFAGHSFTIRAGASLRSDAVSQIPDKGLEGMHESGR